MAGTSLTSNISNGASPLEYHKKIITHEKFKDYVTRP